MKIFKAANHTYTWNDYFIFQNQSIINVAQYPIKRQATFGNDNVASRFEFHCGHAMSFNFQVQFASKHLTDNMFSVVDGKVARVVPTLGTKVMNRDGTFTLNKDIAVAFPGPVSETNQHFLASSRGFDPKGYR